MLSQLNQPSETKVKLRKAAGIQTTFMETVILHTKEVSRNIDLITLIRMILKNSNHIHVKVVEVLNTSTEREIKSALHGERYVRIVVRKTILLQHASVQIRNQIQILMSRVSSLQVLSTTPPQTCMLQYPRKMIRYLPLLHQN